jgi:hypothetical protein
MNAVVNTETTAPFNILRGSPSIEDNANRPDPPFELDLGHFLWIIRRGHTLPVQTQVLRHPDRSRYSRYGSPDGGRGRLSVDISRHVQDELQTGPHHQLHQYQTMVFIFPDIPKPERL